jgi:serine/threonine-protein kinase
VARKIGSRYTVTRVIGRGTCGTVWEGSGPDGPVAVKLLREDLAADQTLIARFVQERTVLTSLAHPHVVAVRDLVVDGNDLALVMDLVRGSDLRERLDTERALRPAEAAGLAADIAAGLAAAHARGVVHRDVKPENVLLDANTGAARLTDFGIARLVDGPRRTRATRIVGTPDYLAPEVIEGCPPGPAVDVYALGTLVFELLTGWTPFGGGHPGAVLRRHVTETVPEIVGMPEPLSELLEGCLSKAPAARLKAAEVSGRLRMLVPELEGLHPLRVPDPRAVLGPASLAEPRASGAPMNVGAVPLVRGPIREEDDSRQTHLNLMRPIREPLGPSAPVPGAVPRIRAGAAMAGAGAGGARLALPALAKLGTRNAPVRSTEQRGPVPQKVQTSALGAGIPTSVGLETRGTSRSNAGPGAGPGAGAVAADARRVGSRAAILTRPNGASAAFSSADAEPDPLADLGSHSGSIPGQPDGGGYESSGSFPSTPIGPNGHRTPHKAAPRRLGKQRIHPGRGRPAGNGSGRVPPNGRPRPGAPRSDDRSSRFSAVAAVTAFSLMAFGGYLWWHDHDQSAAQPAGAPNGQSAHTAARGSLPAIPVSTAAQPVGPLGLVRFGSIAPAPAKPVGAVHFVVAGNSAYAVATGEDGVVRVATAPLGPAPTFGPWTAVPGLVSAASEPAVVTGPSAAAGPETLQVFVLSSADGQIHQAVLTGTAWSPGSALPGAGAAKLAGTPAAAVSGGHVQLIAAGTNGQLLATTGTGLPGSNWQPWRQVAGAGPVDPSVALAGAPDGTLAAYVLRASDAAVMRVMYQDDHWGYAWPTGAVGTPEATYTNGGKPYLFIQTVDGDVQVFEPTGADLRGSMNWAFAGITSSGPVGATAVGGLGVVLCATAADGSVLLYHAEI